MSERGEPTVAQGAGSAPADLDARIAEELAPDLEIVQTLGGGSRVRVYLAREPLLERFVAVKVLRSGVADPEIADARFEREARSAASLAHPNVVTVYRYGRLSDRTPYIVMQYVKGRSLKERLRAEGPLPPREATRVLSDVAEGLAAAHKRGIVHRNVRPSKVLVESDGGRAYLTDFGIAAILDTERGVAPRLTRTGQMVGDPRYTSPERFDGGAITPAADVYSLAILGYELLTGTTPYGDRPAASIVAAHMRESPRPLEELRPGIDPELAALLLRCLSKNPSDRPGALFLARSLSGEKDAGEEWRDGRGGGALEGALRRRLPQFVLAAGSAGLVLLGIANDLVERGLLPGVAYPLTLAFVAFGLAAVSVLSWFHGEKGRQRWRVLEIAILGVLTVTWIGVSAYIILR